VRNKRIENAKRSQPTGLVVAHVWRPSRIELKQRAGVLAFRWNPVVGVCKRLCGGWRYRHRLGAITASCQPDAPLPIEHWRWVRARDGRALLDYTEGPLLAADSTGWTPRLTSRSHSPADRFLPVSRRTHAFTPTLGGSICARTRPSAYELDYPHHGRQQHQQRKQRRVG